MILLAVLALAVAEPAPPPPPPTPPAVVDSMGGTAQVLADFEAAQRIRGPLEGRWRVAASGDAPLYLIELADPGGLPDPRAAAPEAAQLEGAWLDLGRVEAPAGAGYLVAAKQTRRGLVLMFYEGRRPQAHTLRLHTAGDDRWRGTLSAGRRRSAVVMTRERLLAASP